LAKNLKINLKNQQLAKGLNLSGIKKKIAGKRAVATPEPKENVEAVTVVETPTEEVAAPRVKARTTSAFAEGAEPPAAPRDPVAEEPPAIVPDVVEPEAAPSEVSAPAEEPVEVVAVKPPPPPVDETPPPVARLLSRGKYPVRSGPVAHNFDRPKKAKLGPTGRHIKDIVPPKRPTPKPAASPSNNQAGGAGHSQNTGGPKEFRSSNLPSQKAKQYRDIRPARRMTGPSPSFDARDRQGLRAGEDDRWRKRRPKKRGRTAAQIEEMTVRPKELAIRLPITIKDLAAEMKLKSSQLVSSLFMQGIAVTLNDVLDDETTVQLLGHEFQCDISIDTSEEERIRITGKTIGEEVSGFTDEQLAIRPPVVAFMGHVDHGKTSLIDVIRAANVASGEAGDITQHIGAFQCQTPQGPLTILDTPGHEAFSAMRARGAEVTDLVVLVVAGDEGVRQQTIEAIQHAKAANVTIVVAINKCDKPAFDAETIYRQLSENELTPEVWGGDIATVNTSAITKEGIEPLLEMLALQAEVLELKACNDFRARGSVIESEMSKGRGNVATLLVQNGTLRSGDAVVFGQSWGRVKTMHNDAGLRIDEAGPSTPIKITGLSGLPGAGDEFIVVGSDKEARDIAEARAEDVQSGLTKLRAKPSLDRLLQQAEGSEKKVLNVVLRADVQGSLEALKTALQKIESDKATLEIIFSGVGEICESDVQLAAVSNAMILGFHTRVETHADALIKETGVEVRSHDIIYHAIDTVKELMTGLLDKIAIEEETGTAEIKATFKASTLGVICGCLITEGVIHRNHKARLLRGTEIVWMGDISSIKRIKDDVREVKKGFECGILLSGYNLAEEGDIIQAYEIKYIDQEL
jgi:translation initiation factor IF-2